MTKARGVAAHLTARIAWTSYMSCGLDTVDKLQVVLGKRIGKPGAEDTMVNGTSASPYAWRSEYLI